MVRGRRRVQVALAISAPIKPSAVADLTGHVYLVPDTARTQGKIPVSVVRVLRRNMPNPEEAGGFRNLNSQMPDQPSSVFFPSLKGAPEAWDHRPMFGRAVPWAVTGAGLGWLSSAFFNQFEIHNAGWKGVFTRTGWHIGAGGGTIFLVLRRSKC